MHLYWIAGGLVTTMRSYRAHKFNVDKPSYLILALTFVTLTIYAWWYRNQSIYLKSNIKATFDVHIAVHENRKKYFSDFKLLWELVLCITVGNFNWKSIMILTWGQNQVIYFTKCNSTLTWLFNHTQRR